MPYQTRAATMDDVQEVVELVNSERLAQTGETATVPANLVRRWTQPGIELERDTLLVVDPDARLVGYIQYDNTREPRSRPYANLSIAPDTDTEAVGAQLVRFLERRARQDIPSLDPGLRVTVLAWAIEQNTAVLGALAREGFEETRRFYTMRIDLTSSPATAAVPEGYEIRPMRPDEERATFRAMDNAFLDHYGHAEADDTDKSFAQWRFKFLEGEDALPELHLVAVRTDDATGDGHGAGQNGEMDATGAIAGVSFCAPRRGQDEDMGWVNVIGVHRDHRRRGLGEALLLESFAALRRLGKTRAGLGVDASSLTNATRLYEKCGMHVHSSTIQMGKVLRDGREVANLG
jgi:GNAT superfamily N-acetyltransferase